VTIAADDIQVDQILTIHSRIHARKMRVGPRSITTEPMFEGDDFPAKPGVPLRVLSTSLPFVLCAVIQPDGSEHGPQVVDVRSFNLMKLGEDYMEALLSFAAENM